MKQCDEALGVTAPILGMELHVLCLKCSVMCSVRCTARYRKMYYTCTTHVLW